MTDMLPRSRGAFIRHGRVDMMAKVKPLLDPILHTFPNSERMTQLMGYQVRRVQLLIMQQFERMARSEISPSIFHMLLLIEENPGVSMSTIANANGVDRASLMPAIQRMERAGWIERVPSPSDGRVLMLRCTTAGRALNRRMLAKAKKLESDLQTDLSADEQAQLLDLLRRVADGYARRKLKAKRRAPAQR